MPTAVTMPQLGESVTEGTVTRWYKSVGESVAVDEDLFEVSTDKVDTEVPSPVAGTVVAILVQEGETVPVGTELCRVDEQVSAAALPSIPPQPAGEAAPPPLPPQVPPVPPSLPPSTPPPLPPEIPAVASPEAESPPLPAAPDPFESAVTAAVRDVDSIESPRATFRIQYPSPEGVAAPLHAHPSAATEPPRLDGGRELHAQPSAATQPPVSPVEQPLHAHPSEAGAPPEVTPPPKPRARVTEAGEKRLAEEPPDDLRHDGDRRGILSPVVRKLADEYGVNLEKIIGTGTGGRITRDDVIAAAGGGSEAAGAPEVEPVAVTSAEGSGGRVEELSRMRIRIARHMRESRSQAAHVFAAMEIDCDAVARAREAHRDSFEREEGFHLTYLPFFSLAVCNALLEFPVVNSSISIDAGSATFHDHVNLGIAVDLAGDGLVVPVVRDAERLTLRALARQGHELAIKARNGELEPDDVAGGTFTITNPGPFGTYLSVPIINYPEVAILSLEGVAERPVVRDGAVVAGLTTIVGLSWDHRAFDGGTADRFLAGIRDRVEGWDWLTLAG